MDKQAKRDLIRKLLAKIYGQKESIRLRAIVETSPRYEAMLVLADLALKYQSPSFLYRLRKALPRVVKHP